MTAYPDEGAIGAATAAVPRVGRIPADTFSNRLVLARRLAGMTIEEASEAAGLSKSSWANWENGRRAGAGPPNGQPEAPIGVMPGGNRATSVTLQFHLRTFRPGQPATSDTGADLRQPFGHPTLARRYEPIRGARSHLR